MNLDKSIFDLIFNSYTDVVKVIDQLGNFIFINHAAENKMKMKPSEWLGKNIEELIPNSVLFNALYTGSPQLYKPKVIQNKKYLINAIPLKRNGKIVGAFATYQEEEEITKLKYSLVHFSKKIDSNRIEKTTHSVNILPHKTDGFFISSESILMAELKKVQRLASSDLSILIRGESGVGKEVIAKNIHQWSNRKLKPFIAINCAAIPESLLESELFGYEEGAFTGAKRNGRKGKFELANEGTIFLDEIGDMSYHLQAKLLRVLQQKELERVGGNDVIPLNVRVLAATNRDLETMIKDGSFREDLYYRINGFMLHIPPLRERKKDIEVLIHNFLEEYNQKYNMNLRMSKEAFDILVQYTFPGNVRELRNVLEHAFVLADTDEIKIADLPKNLLNHFKYQQNTSILKLNSMESVNDTPPIPQSLDFTENISKLEIKLINEALRRSNNNRSDAIKLLGISRRSFYERLKKYQDGIN
jgi:transcriptional regulator with PAS, ATPase and Fis domain